MIVEAAADLGQRLALLKLPEVDKPEQRLAQLWQSGPLVLVHVNHFESLVCYEQIEELVRALPDLERSAVSLAVIGPGEATAAKAFKAKFARRFPVLIDRDARTFDVIGA